MAGEGADSTDDAAESADPELPGDAAHPPFLRHGVFTVAVYVVAVSAVLYLSSGDLQGPALVTFSVGFSVFIAVTARNPTSSGVGGSEYALCNNPPTPTGPTPQYF